MSCGFIIHLGEVKTGLEMAEEVPRYYAWRAVGIGTKCPARFSNISNLSSHVPQQLPHPPPPQVPSPTPAGLARDRLDDKRWGWAGAQNGGHGAGTWKLSGQRAPQQQLCTRQERSSKYNVPKQLLITSASETPSRFGASMEHRSRLF